MASCRPRGSQTGKLLANTGAASGNIYIQLLTGVAPGSNTVTGATSAATWAVSTVVQRTISTPFIGTSTGSAINGGYGVGIVASTLTSLDKVTDLSNTLRTPPNNVTFTVSGLVNAADMVMVAPWDGTTLDADGNPVPEDTQLQSTIVLTSGTVTSIVSTTTIPADTPPTGTLRVRTAANYMRLVSYTSWTGSTFTVTSISFSADNSHASKKFHISYIDKLATATTATFTGVYTSNRNLMVRVRSGGASPIKTFVTSAVLGSGGGSTTAIRTSDL